MEVSQAGALRQQHHHHPPTPPCPAPAGAHSHLANPTPGQQGALPLAEPQRKAERRG